MVGANELYTHHPLELSPVASPKLRLDGALDFFITTGRVANISGAGIMRVVLKMLIEKKRGCPRSRAFRDLGF
jgi:hypothetical protein